MVLYYSRPKSIAQANQQFFFFKLSKMLQFTPVLRLPLKKLHLLTFVIYDIMKIWRKRMTQLMNESINDEAVGEFL